MTRYDGLGALVGAAEAGIGFADERCPDTTLTAKRLYAIRRLRPRRQVERICNLGARLVLELLDELDRYHDLGDDLDRRLGRYAELNPALLRITGGDRLPPVAVLMVRR